MEQTSFEKAIEIRAQARLDKEINELVGLLNKNSLAQRIKVNWRTDKEARSESLSSALTVLSWDAFQSASNYREAKSTRLKEIIKEETESVLNKLDSVKELFEIIANQIN